MLPIVFSGLLLAPKGIRARSTAQQLTLSLSSCPSIFFLFFSLYLEFFSSSFIFSMASETLLFNNKVVVLRSGCYYYYMEQRRWNRKTRKTIAGRPVKKGENIKMGADNVLARSLPGQQSDFICLFLSI